MSNGSNILITGGAGNIGSALAERLSRGQRRRVVVLDNLSTGSVSKIPLERENLILVKGDANDVNDVMPLMIKFDFEYVYHYAAIVGVQRTLENPLLVLRDIEGIRNLLQLSKTCRVRKFAFSSSSEVYGEPFEIPQNEETTPLNSRLPYAVVKNLAEVYVRTYYKEYGLEYIVFRFFNTYGPNQSDDFVVPRFVKKALAGEDICVYGTGEQTRTFCYVDDNVEATVAIAEGQAYKNCAVNIGSDVETKVVDLAELVIRMTHSRSRIRFLPPLSEGDMSRRRPHNKIMRDVLGRDLISLENGIERLITFYKGGK